MKDNMDNTFYKSYVIKKGDSLYQISKDYNVNTKLLAELNGLNVDDYIYPDQVILVPLKNVSYYITKEGDSLDMLGSVFGVNTFDLIEQNKTIYLQEGQLIYYKRD